ncbi:hypothetical protein [Algivirga pacifica]|uniref:DUF4382 domain-containing protein n=1 Tax=Algivirga pacifica TaxID=1162670 RepID=A0ABP9D5E3_9BACT
MRYKNFLGIVVLGGCSLTACELQEDKEQNPSDATLNFEFAFNEAQERLDNFGKPVGVAEGNAAQSPQFNSMSVHYIEFVQDKWTMIGDGAVVYEGATRSSANTQFPNAIEFDEAIQHGEGETFLEVPISALPAGTYEYLRVSVTYQNADVQFNLLNLPYLGDYNKQKGTLAGFIGFNTYISSHTAKQQTIEVHSEKPQGFWIFEPQFEEPLQGYYLQSNPSGVLQQQIPAGGVTVVNPLEEFGVTIPEGSCVVTGKLEEPLVITGEETENKQVTLSFSTNNSFEWIDANPNGEWDIDVEGNIQEPVVDMGLRGLQVIVK